MPSRTELKKEIVSLRQENERLFAKLSRAEGALEQVNFMARRNEEAYRDMRIAFERLDKEYRALGEQWNAFQGCVSRPTERDLERRRAQGEIITGLAQLIANVLLPKDMR